MAGYKLKDSREVIRATQPCSLAGGPPLQWSANMSVEWIRENGWACEGGEYPSGEGFFVTHSELDEARFHYKTISKQALDDGSAVHKMIEGFLTEGPIPKVENKQQQNAFDAFMDWFTEHEEFIETIATEQRVVSQWWAGTLDWKLKYYGKQGVIDFKTSKPPIRPAMRYQTAAYRSVDPKNEFHAVLRLDKETGKYEYKDFAKTYYADLETFYDLLVAYYSLHPIVAKRAGWDKIAYQMTKLKRLQEG